MPKDLRRLRTSIRTFLPTTSIRTAPGNPEKEDSVSDACTTAPHKLENGGTFGDFLPKSRAQYRSRTFERLTENYRIAFKQPVSPVV